MEFSQAHMEFPQHDDTAAIARINALSFTEVRNELRAAHSAIASRVLRSINCASY